MKTSEQHRCTAALSLRFQGFFVLLYRRNIKVCFDRSCYILGGADIVIFNPNGILVMDVQDNCLDDDSTEEGELASELKLKEVNW